MKIYLKRRTGLEIVLLRTIVLSSIFISAPVWADSQFYFIRHAEFDKTDPAKPLNATGLERSEALAGYFTGKNITHIYATHTNRTRDTVMPLAKERNLEVEQFPRPGSVLDGSKVTNLSKGKVAIEPMTAALEKIPDGGSVVVSANSGNLFAIMAGLGVQVNSPEEPCAVAAESCLPCADKSCFPVKEFHNIWIVTIADDSVKMQKSRYGEVPFETSKTGASDVYLRGWEHYRKTTPDDYASSIAYFEQAIELDSDFAPAHTALAAVYWNSAWRSWLEPSELSTSEMLNQSRIYLQRAMQSPSARTRQVASEMAAYSRRKPETALAEAEVAISLDANDPAGYLARANALLKAKRPTEAIASMRNAMQLDSEYPSYYLTRLGRAQFDLGEYAEAATTLENATQLNPRDDRAYVYLAAAYGHMEHEADALSAVDSVNRLRSENRWGELTIEEINRWRWTGDRKRLKEGLILAGVESGYDWYSRVTGSGNNIEIEGATVIGINQAKKLHEAGVPFIDFSTIGLTTQSIPGAHILRWGRDNEMGPREFNLVRLMEVTTKSGGMVVYHPNGSNKRWGALAAAYAADLGFENVYYLRDSLDDWKKAGYPVDSVK